MPSMPLLPATALALLLPAWPAAATLAAEGLPAAQAVPAPALEAALVLLADAARALAPAGARVQVQAGSADARLRLLPCARVEPFLAAGVRPWGRTRVGLRCAEGPARWSFHLPATVQVWAPAVAPAATLPAGTVLQAAQLQQAEVDWAAAPQLPYGDTQALVGRELARAVTAGVPLRSADLRARQWFAAGDPVRVVARGAGFAVSADGHAATAGIEGQKVRVRIGENRVVEGRAVDHRTVEVGP